MPWDFIWLRSLESDIGQSVLMAPQQGGPFIARLCTQCGQCADACPFRSIVLDAGFDPLESGTPRVEPKRIPCWLCMRCGPACPTGALRPVDKRQAAMGKAVIDRTRCYTYIGSVLCKTCFEKCPLKARAIELDMGLYPVITKECVGCGVCEHVCPAQCIDTRPEAQGALAGLLGRIARG